jgi:hypothetical protein
VAGASSSGKGGPTHPAFESWPGRHHTGRHRFGIEFDQGFIGTVLIRNMLIAGLVLLSAFLPSDLVTDGWPTKPFLRHLQEYLKG